MTYDPTEVQQGRVLAVLLWPCLLGVGAWLVPVVALLLLASVAGCPDGSGCADLPMGVFVADVVVILLLEVLAGVAAASIGVRHGMARIAGVAGIVAAFGACSPMLIAAYSQVPPTELDLTFFLSYGVPPAFAFFVGYWLTLRALRGDSYNASRWWPGDVQWLHDVRRDEDHRSGT